MARWATLPRCCCRIISDQHDRRALSAAPLTTDLLGGQVDLGMDFRAPMCRWSKMRSCGLSPSQAWARRRSVRCHDRAGGRHQRLEATAWYALVAPTGAPADVVRKINGVTNDFLTSDKGKQALATFDMLPAGGTPGDLRAYIGSELTMGSGRKSGEHHPVNSAASRRSDIVGRWKTLISITYFRLLGVGTLFCKCS